VDFGADGWEERRRRRRRRRGAKELNSFLFSVPMVRFVSQHP